MDICGYNFSEPRRIGIVDNIDRAAVYVVMTRDSILSVWSYLYVGQTGDVAERFSRHGKKDCWLKYQRPGGLYIAVILVPDKNERLNIETDLRHRLEGLPCNRQ